MTTAEVVYVVRLRERGDQRHKLLASDRLTTKRVHAVTFSDQAKASDAARWMLDNNGDTLDHGQVADAHTGRVVEQLEAAS